MMKKLLKSAAAVLAASLLLFVGCSSDSDDGPDTYRITYKNGTEKLEGLKPTEYMEGSEAKLPTAVPGMEGYRFGGWFTEIEFKNKVIVASGGGDKTFYAKLDALYRVIYGEEEITKFGELTLEEFVANAATLGLEPKKHYIVNDETKKIALTEDGNKIVSDKKDEIVPGGSDENQDGDGSGNGDESGNPGGDTSGDNQGSSGDGNPGDNQGNAGDGNTENPGTETPGGNTGDTPSEGSTVDKPTTEVPVNATVQIVKSEGWLNSAYIIFEQIEGATYTVKCDDVAIDEPLIRYYDEYVWYEPTESADLSVRWERKTLNNVVRADALGLAAGSHTMSVCANGTNGSTDYSRVTMTVADHDRQGFAFTGTETPGAYNKDGTLKSGAVVLYVTKDTAKTVSYNGYTGLQDILSEKSLKNMTVPLDVRIIGTIMLSDMDRIDSSAEGLQIKNNKSAVTVEGVGHDAAINGFGVLIRSAKYVEFANLGIYNFMDDGISIDTANSYLWMHNNDIFYGKVGGDSDQAKGDGSLDFKKSTYSTNSYNHFWDSGKCCLLDASASSSGGSNYLTYHHNWFDHSDSRHPRIRNASAVHVYNNYYDGNAKYGIGITSGASCLSEGNFFRNCKFPMMSSLQGNDIYAGTDKADAANNGTFSKEEGGIIKAFNNHIEGAVTSYWPYNGTGTNWTKGAKNSLPSGIDTKVHFDTYEVSERASILTSAVKTVVGAHTYSNFDTELGDSGLGLSRVPTQPEQARTDVISYSGRHNPDFVWEFDNATEDTNSNVIAELKSAVTNYAGKLTKIQNTGSSGSSGDSGSTGGNTGNEGGSTEGGDTDVPVTPPATGSAVVALVSNGTVSPTDSRVTCTSCSINTKETNGAISIVYNEVLYTTIKMESSSTIQVQATAGSTITVVGSLPSGKQNCFKYAKKGDETNKTTVKLADKTTETTTTFQQSFTSTGNDVITKGDTASIGVIIITEAE